MARHYSASARSTRVTEEAFCTWVGIAAPGEALAYHRGNLARDAQSSATRLEPSELARVAKRARMAAEAGLVHLVQRRNGPDDYTYLVIARPRAPTEIRGALGKVLSRATAG